MQKYSSRQQSPCKLNSRKTFTHRTLSFVIALTLALGACSQGDFTTEEIKKSDAISKYLDKEIVHQRIIDRHMRASSDSEPQDINDSHIIRVKRNQNSNDDGGPEISTARRNGKVVAMFDAWVKPNPKFSYDRVNYFIFSFMNNDTMESGQISNKEPAKYSEVWRYHNGTWCAIIPELKINITAAALHDVVFDKENVAEKPQQAKKSGFWGKLLKTVLTFPPKPEEFAISD